VPGVGGILGGVVKSTVLNLLWMLALHWAFGQKPDAAFDFVTRNRTLLN